MRSIFHDIVFMGCAVAILSCLSCLTAPVFAQTEAQLRTAFTDHSRAGVHEEIFVHCDKNLYLPDEICWFKIYCVDALLHQPISLSKLAFWELVDRDGNPVVRLKIGLKDGFGDGSYQLPRDLNSGTYRIRCYTNWMKNFDAGYYFEKEISVINPHQFYAKDTVKREGSAAVRFYPEGGNLVNDLPSTIGFKIFGPGNRGVNGYGYVVDDLNDTLQLIRTTRMGIGRFAFVPRHGRSYNAIVLLPHGEKIIAAIPNAYENGYVMHLADSAGRQLKITVQVKSSTGAVYLFVHTRGSVRIVESAPLTNNQAVFIIDKDRLGDGISHLTIFNAEKRPVCERLYFNYPKRQLQIQVSADKNTYRTREKIAVSVVTTEDSVARPANLSMAVYKIDPLQAFDKMNIENYLWLSADLPESVDSPEYYFDLANQDRETAMDNLLLTQGWRRFRWEDVLQGKGPGFKFLPEYTGHIILGKIFDPATKMPARNRAVFVSSPGVHPIFNAASSDSNGMLRWDMKDFYSNGELIVQPANAEDSMFRIEIQSPFADAYSGRPVASFSLSGVDSAALAEYQKDVLVQREYLGSKLERVVVPVGDSLSFFGKPDIRYLLDDYVRFTTMEEVLREYVADVSVRNRGGHFEVNVFDRRREHTLLEPAPLVLMDGTPTDINKVIGYDPLKVKRLDIVPEAYYYGNLAFGGILSFVTYGGDMPGFELDPQTIVMDYAGLEARREFYCPAYTTKEALDSRLPDFRRLLYWEPAVITDERGGNVQSFFSSDEPGRYVVVVQGIASDGKVGWAVKGFRVR